MKGHLTKAIPISRRSLYTVSTSVSSSPPFFDSGYTPATPRLVNSAQITLQSGAQQSKSQSGSHSQPTTSLALAPSPLPTNGAQAGSRQSNSSTNGISPLFYPSTSFIPPAFFLPSLLSSSERVPGRSGLYLESGAYGIPKRRPGSSQQQPCFPSGPASSLHNPPSTSHTPSISSLPNVINTSENLDLSVQVGDDSYFVRPNAIGVADGVGGWANRPNGNSAIFSRRLMHYCSHELSLLYPPHPPPAAPINIPFVTPTTWYIPEVPPIVDPDPVTILQKAYEKTLELSRLDGTLGSTTALLAILHSATPPPSSSIPTPFLPIPKPQLRIAHVGDCSIGIIRARELVYRSSEQQHRFNYPFQLGPASSTTPAKDAVRIELDVEEGDVIVVSSDGMGDNLWDEDVLEEALKWGSDVRGMSEALAKRAQKISLSDSTDETPFARRAREENKTHEGGKADDISVLVAVIEGPSTASDTASAGSAAAPVFRRYT